MICVLKHLRVTVLLSVTHWEVHEKIRSAVMDGEISEKANVVEARSCRIWVVAMWMFTRSIFYVIGNFPNNTLGEKPNNDALCEEVKA